MDAEEDSESGASTGISSLELAKSYFAFVLRALKLRKRVALTTFAALVLGTFLAVSVWPRTYTCVTVLSAQDNGVLGGEKTMDTMRSAPEAIMNRDNIAAIVDEVGLTKSWEASQSPVSRLKQRLMSKIRGELPESDKRDALISLVESRVNVTPPGWMQSKVIVSVDWHEPKMAAALADAADKSFLKARHVAEISTISEYIGILETHAGELRTEIQQLSGQAQTVRDEKQAKAHMPAPAGDTPHPRVVAAAPRPVAQSPEAAGEIAELRAQVAAKEAAIKELVDQRQRRIADSQARLTDLRSQYTPEHPLVVAAERSIASLASDSPQVLLLRADLASLSAGLKAKVAAKDLASQGGPRVASVPPSAGTPGASPGIEPLPAEIMRLMQEDSDELDPAVAAQFRTAVAKYASLRDKIGTARVDLDTAQAAFKHRYQIVSPAEVPAAPSKPKVPLLILAGLLLSLVTACLVSILAELRTGRIVEVWQVHQLGVPLLGDMPWPPKPDA